MRTETVDVPISVTFDPPLPEIITEVKRVVVHPDETLVFEMPESATRADQLIALRHLRWQFPDNHVAVLPGGIRLANVVASDQIEGSGE